MTPQLFGQAVLRGLLVCIIGSAGYFAWGFFRSGQWPSSDNFFYIVAPVAFIAGFLNRLFDEHRKET